MNRSFVRALGSLVFAFSFCCCSSTQLFARCGVERWSVKTGTDTDAQQVDLANPKPAAIADLVQLTPPAPIPPDNRVAPTETTVWVLNATLTDYKHEEGRTGDNDYHLVLDDGQGNTMVAEIPSPDCVDDSSPFAAQIAGARADFDAQLSAAQWFQTANIPVQVTGVGMFDFPHGQHGAAPNVIELHPVLAIVFNPSTEAGMMAAKKPGTPELALSLPSAEIHLAQGSTVSVKISASAANATFTTTGLPAGVTAHVTPLGNGKAAVTLRASEAAPTGSFPFTVTGTADGNSRNQTATLRVSSAAQSAPGQPWDYQIVTAASDQEMLVKANKLGADDWEMVGVVRQGSNGWKAFFKRVKRDF